jgi:hypothetical protein
MRMPTQRFAAGLDATLTAVEQSQEQKHPPITEGLDSPEPGGTKT